MKHKSLTVFSGQPGNGRTLVVRLFNGGHALGAVI